MNEQKSIMSKNYFNNFKKYTTQIKNIRKYSVKQVNNDSKYH